MNDPKAYSYLELKAECERLKQAFGGIYGDTYEDEKRRMRITLVLLEIETQMKQMEKAASKTEAEA